MMEESLALTSHQKVMHLAVAMGKVQEALMRDEEQIEKISENNDKIFIIQERNSLRIEDQSKRIDLLEKSTKELEISDRIRSEKKGEFDKLEERVTILEDVNKDRQSTRNAFINLVTNRYFGFGVAAFILIILGCGDFIKTHWDWGLFK